MPFMTINTLTGNEIKRNYTNCGEFHVSQWIQEGRLENTPKLKSKRLNPRRGSDAKVKAAETQFLSVPVMCLLCSGLIMFTCGIKKYACQTAWDSGDMELIK